MKTVLFVLLALYVHWSHSYQHISFRSLPSDVQFMPKWAGHRHMISGTRLQMVVLPSSRPRSGDPRKPVVPPPPINYNIKADPVRLIAPKVGEDGEIGEEMLGIYSLEEALEKADEMELDLVMINEKGDPPVCKIIDYGKFKYSMEKKKKENMKKQVKGGLKEVKMSYKIDVHDFDVRVRAAQRFIAAGDRIKVVIQFKGREMQHKDLGQQLLDRFIKPLAEICTVEGQPVMEGRAMFLLIAPKKT